MLIDRYTIVIELEYLYCVECYIIAVIFRHVLYKEEIDSSTNCHDYDAEKILLKIMLLYDYT